MEQYTVTGMSCAACSARVEKAVGKVAGVSACSVSLLTNSMGVEGTALEQDIIAAVEAAGYGASRKRNEKQASGDKGREEAALADRETPLLKKRLWASLVFLAVLMYISMGHMMWDWWLPDALTDNHVAVGLLQLLLTGIIMVIKPAFFYQRLQESAARSPQYGYSRGAGGGHFLCIQHVRAFLP